MESKKIPSDDLSLDSTNSQNTDNAELSDKEDRQCHEQDSIPNHSSDNSLVPVPTLVHLALPSAFLAISSSNNGEECRSDKEKTIYLHKNEKQKEGAVKGNKSKASGRKEVLNDDVMEKVHKIMEKEVRYKLFMDPLSCILFQLNIFVDKGKI